MKRPHLKQLITILTIGIITSALYPRVSEAAKHTQTSILDTDQQEMHSLRPADFKHVLAQTDSIMVVMKSYVENIQNQADISLEHMQSINDTLRSDIIRHQKTAKENATNWGAVQKKILEINQSIIQFNVQFQAHYEHLSIAIQYKQTEQLQSNITELFNLISQNKMKADQLIFILQDFQSSIELDLRNLKNDTNTLIPIINSETGDITELQNRITADNDIIKKNKDILWDLISSGRATTSNLADTRNKIASAEADIQKLKVSLSGIQSDVAILTDTQNKMTNMAKEIDVAIMALKNISTQWDTVNVKFENVLAAVSTINPNMLELMQTDVNLAQKEWQDLQVYTEKIQRLYENGFCCKVL